jgi:hypothetical protein
MSTFENIVQGAAEKLMEDERLRANLTDDEANVLINWAIEWLEGHMAKASNEAAARQAVQAEVNRLRPAMQKINDLLVGDQVPVWSAAIKALGLSPAQTAAGKALDRIALIRSLTEQLTQAWRKQ